jgi:hypothetical protein
MSFHYSFAPPIQLRFTQSNLRELIILNLPQSDLDKRLTNKASNNSLSESHLDKCLEIREFYNGFSDTHTQTLYKSYKEQQSRKQLPPEEIINGL